MFNLFAPTRHEFNARSYSTIREYLFRQSCLLSREILLGSLKAKERIVSADSAQKELEFFGVITHKFYLADCRAAVYSTLCVKQCVL